MPHRDKPPSKPLVDIAAAIVILIAVVVLLVVRVTPTRFFASVNASSVEVSPVSDIRTDPEQRAVLRGITVSGRELSVTLRGKFRDGDFSCPEINAGAEPSSLGFEATDPKQPIELRALLIEKRTSAASDSGPDVNSKPDAEDVLTVNAEARSFTYRLAAAKLTGHVSFSLKPLGPVTVSMSGVEFSRCPPLNGDTAITLNQVDLHFDGAEWSALVQLAPTTQTFELQVDRVRFQHPGFSGFVHRVYKHDPPGSSVLGGVFNDLEFENRTITLLRGDDVNFVLEHPAKVWLQPKEASQLGVQVSGAVSTASRNNYELCSPYLLWAARQPWIMTAYSSIAAALGVFLGVRKWRER